MQSKVQILFLENRSGISKASGKPYAMTVCQAVVFTIVPSTGEEVQRVGELVLPKDHPTIVPGFYNAEFEINVDSQTKRIGGMLKMLTPMTAKQLATPFDAPKKAA